MTSHAAPSSEPAAMARVLSVVYWLLVAALGVYLVHDAGFGLIDDHVFFEPKYVHGHWRLFWGDGSARFFPLNGKEFLIFNELGLVSPGLYYAVQAAKLALCAWLSVSVLMRWGASRTQAYLASLALFSTPAFLVSVSRLFIADISSFMLFLVMLRLAPSEDARRADWRFWAALAAANLAFYHKEPGFLAAGTMAGLLLLQAYGKKSTALSRFAAGIVVSCLVYVLAYYALAWRFAGARNYTSQRVIELPELAAYFLGNDTLLMLALPFLAWGALAALRRTRRIDLPLAALAAGAVYVAAFFVLRIISTWYLLPAYAFVLPALGQSLARLRGKPWTARGRAAALAVAVLVVQSAVGGWHHLRFNKAATSGASALVSALRALPEAPDGRPTPLFIPRLDVNSEIGFALKTMLAAKGMDRRFELRYGEPFAQAQDLDDRQALTLVTPFTPLSDANLRDLDNLSPPLFATPRAPADWSLAGTWLPWCASGQDWRAFADARLWLHGHAALYGAAAGRQAHSPNLDALQAELTPQAQRICPLGPSEWSVSLRNASDRDMDFAAMAPLERPVIILITARPGEKMRVVGNVGLPDRLSAGESVVLSAHASTTGLAPSVLAGFLGISHGQFVYLADPRRLFEGQVRPSPGSCLGR